MEDIFIHNFSAASFSPRRPRFEIPLHRSEEAAAAENESADAGKWLLARGPESVQYSVKETPPIAAWCE